jgi:hypothetical protein
MAIRYGRSIRRDAIAKPFEVALVLRAVFAKSARVNAQ